MRVAMGHKEPFHLTMLGIGNEQWETEQSGFFERYRLFEECIHAKYPDMIWFDGEKSYATPNYYVQKLFSRMNGTEVLDTLGEEKNTRREQIYYNPVRDGKTGAIYCKIVNASEERKILNLEDETGKPYQIVQAWLLGGMEKEAVNSIDDPQNIVIREVKYLEDGEKGRMVIEKIRLLFCSWHNHRMYTLWTFCYHE